MSKALCICDLKEGKDIAEPEQQGYKCMHLYSPLKESGNRGTILSEPIVNHVNTLDKVEKRHFSRLERNSIRATLLFFETVSRRKRGSNSETFAPSSSRRRPQENHEFLRVAKQTRPFVFYTCCEAKKVNEGTDIWL